MDFCISLGRVKQHLVCKIVSLNRVLTAKGKIIGAVIFYEYMSTVCTWSRKLAFVLCLQFHDNSV